MSLQPQLSSPRGSAQASSSPRHRPLHPQLPSPRGSAQASSSPRRLSYAERFSVLAPPPEQEQEPGGSRVISYAGEGLSYQDIAAVGEEVLQALATPGSSLVSLRCVLCCVCVCMYGLTKLHIQPVLSPSLTVTLLSGPSREQLPSCLAPRTATKGTAVIFPCMKKGLVVESSTCRSP